VQNNVQKKKKNLLAHHRGQGVCVLLVELDDISEGKPKADIGMQHEDKVWLAPQDLVTKVVQSTSRTHRLVFPEVPDWDPESGLCVVDKSMEERRIKEPNKNDFTQTRDLTQDYEGNVSKIHENLNENHVVGSMIMRMNDGY